MKQDQIAFSFDVGHSSIGWAVFKIADTPESFHTLLGIEEVRLYDIDPAATAKLRRNLAQAAPGLAVSCAASTATTRPGS